MIAILHGIGHDETPPRGRFRALAWVSFLEFLDQVAIKGPWMIWRAGFFQ